MEVRLISKTTGAAGTEYEGKSIDEIVVGNARVSSSREVNELFDEPYKLIRHCSMEGHTSIYEQANLGIQVKTSRAMGREILRHEIKPQEFSQRYAIVTEFEHIELRVAGKSNRQSSGEVTTNTHVIAMYDELQKQTEIVYRHAIDKGIAPETARFILTENATTTMNLNGNIRSWISFLSQRLHHTAQKEIRMVAEEVKKIFIQECPIISEALYNFEHADKISVFDRLVLEKHIKKGNVFRNF